MHIERWWIRKDPLYRSREWSKVERAKERRTKKGEWFRGVVFKVFS